ncbi:tRNA epoxyqueuosine(34) reductase QueG [bacterium]|nr:tRNA epoxyqueuosine(34) reductase QueG [bacterium]
MTDFNNSLNHSLKNSLKLLKDSFELNQIEAHKIKSPLSIDFYEKWLANNYQGTMEYLNTHLPIKKNPLLLDSKLKSVISVAQSYYPAVEPIDNKSPARIALYAQNQDYHIWLKQKLIKIIEQLKISFPNETFLPFVDSGPILERDMAYQNGLGWFGKNSCLIHPQHGSLFFVAEILTTMEILTEDQTFEPIPDFCGKCTKCMDICPTEALIAPRTLKADQCISYLTIEAKTAPPIELRKKIGDWFFGCDLCQTVCPWNEKVFRKKNIETSDLTSTQKLLPLSDTKKKDLIDYFRFLLTSSHKQIQKHHFGSPLSRAGAKGLKRNALIVIANQNLAELKKEVKSLETDELKELADWTLAQLS